MTSIAIIGAGMAGVTLAHLLSDMAEVTLIEKARGVGGRMSTRYADPFEFDHGAQYVTVRSEEFSAFLRPLREASIVQEWQPHVVTLEKGQPMRERIWFDPHYVAVPRMNSLCKYLARDASLLLQTHITGMERKQGRWVLPDKEGGRHGPFDWVISTAPAPQSATLLPAEFTGHGAIAAAQLQGCFSLMLGFDAPLLLDWQAATVKDSPISWIACNHSKPQRHAPDCLLIQTANDWSEAHLEEDQAQVETIVLNELEALLGVTLPEPSYRALHRWRYANVREPVGEPYLLDEAQTLAACGDWCLQGRVEAAFLSACHLSHALHAHMRK